MNRNFAFQADHSSASHPMLIFFALLLLAIFSSLSLSGQDIRVNGQVKSSAGEPLGGVTVSVRDRAGGTLLQRSP